MRLSDWSSDVCSSDLEALSRPRQREAALSEGDAGHQRQDDGVERQRLGAVHGERPPALPSAQRQLDEHRDHRKDRHRLEGDDQHELPRSEEHTSELQSLMRISYAVLCLKTKTTNAH